MAKRPKSAGEKILTVMALTLGMLFALPHLGVLVAAFSGSTDTLAALFDTVLLNYAGTTLWLVPLVGFFTFVLGTGTAWLVSMTEFRSRRIFEIALVLPLAFPAYVLAYAYTHLLDHPGIVQSTLRAVRPSKPPLPQ